MHEGEINSVSLDDVGAARNPSIFRSSQTLGYATDNLISSSHTNDCKTREQQMYLDEESQSTIAARRVFWRCRSRDQNVNDNKQSTSSATNTDLLRTSIKRQLRAIFGSWTSLMFAFVPAGFAVNYAGRGPVTVFLINFFAIFPSGMALSFAIEDFSKHLSETLGGILSMSLRSDCSTQ